ncbi:MAG: von Willebrand factor type A domain-containing protein [Brevundimonas sp.]|nr:von Willebrand factor type A domain-containing protein [Brevundimonas sp.]
MNRTKPNRIAAVAVSGSLILSLSGPPAIAVPSQDRVVDGEPTAAACAPYGLGPPVPLEGVVVTGTRTARAPTTAPAPAPKLQVREPGYAPPPPPPPPPPAPPRPPVVTQTPSGEIVVDGQRTGQMVAPPATSTERYPDATPNPVKRVADEPVSTFSIDVDTAAYSNVRRFLGNGQRPPRDAVRVEEMVNYFDYDLPAPTSMAQPFAISTSVVDSPWSPGRKIVHVALKGYELPANERRPLNLTFMVDVSGSMGGQDKLGLAQRTMNLLIDRMRPQDSIAVTTYASGARILLTPTPGTEKLKLRCAVASLSAGGATAGAAGMVNAYDQAEAAFGADKVNRILMFTDGDFNVGVTEDKRLEDYVAEKRGTGIYLSIYGFGRGNYQDARMQTIAQAGNGTAAYVDDLDEARRLFGPAFDRGAFPIADDVKIQVEFNPARVSEYRLIGYETRMLSEADFSNDRIDAGEVGSGAAVVALYEITPVGGPSQLPDRRYEQTTAPTGDPSGEWAFVQVRFKPPGGDTSQLMQRPVTGQDARPGTEVRWALAVAGAAQLLRGDPWLAPDYGWDQVIDLAQGARGEDPWGQRAEFVNLSRAASELGPVRAP